MRMEENEKKTQRQTSAPHPCIQLVQIQHPLLHNPNISHTCIMFVTLGLMLATMTVLMTVLMTVFVTLLMAVTALDTTLSDSLSQEVGIDLFNPFEVECFDTQHRVQWL